MKIGQSIQQSFDLYRKNFGILILATLLTGIISFFTAGILAGPLTGGLLLLCLKLMRGEEAEIGELFAHFDKLGSTLLVVAAMWGAMLVTAMLAYIPVVGHLFRIAVGPFTGIIFILAIGFIVDRNIAPVAALERAFRCFMTNPLPIWMYSFVIGILAGSGAIIFLIPVILTAPFGAIGMAIAYKELVALEIDRGPSTNSFL